jgi:hypothetical protein
MVNYQLVRSKRRKTLGLQVKCGRVIVRAPSTLSEEYISLFIKEKAVWLKAKIAEQLSKPQSCHFNQGSTLLYLGKPAKINISLVKRPNVFLTNQSLPSADKQYKKPETNILNVDVNQQIYGSFSDNLQKSYYVQKQLNKFFKFQAQHLISERLTVISNKIRLTPKKVTVRKYRARWGSCNSRGEVSFNYLLMMTPLFVIDYVIVHELCHLVHLNHSQHFWQLVAQHFPEYKTAKQWLKNNQSQLYWQVD